MGAVDEQLGKLSDRIEGVTTREIPEIKVSLEELKGTQNLILSKISSLEAKAEHQEVLFKHMSKHDVRIAALELKETTHSKTSEQIKAFGLKLLAGLILAVFGFLMGKYF